MDERRRRGAGARVEEAATEAPRAPAVSPPAPAAASAALAAALCMALMPAIAAQTLPRVGWGIVDSVGRSDSDEYFSSLRKDYKFRIQTDYTRYTIDLLVDPCRDRIMTGDRGENCCEGTNIAGCQHHPVIQGGPDLQIAYFQNAHMPNCRHTPFEANPNCGTFIEVHRPLDRAILADAQIDQDDFPSGYSTTRIETHNLCVGDHELWWVVRTPSGPYVLKVRHFFVRGPSCAVPPGGVPVPESGLPAPSIP